MPKARRTVTLEALPKPHSRLWAYGYDDLARVLKTTPGAVRARVARGWEPTLNAVADAIQTVRMKRESE